MHNQTTRPVLRTSNVLGVGPVDLPVAHPSSGGMNISLDTLLSLEKNMSNDPLSLKRFAGFVSSPATAQPTFALDSAPGRVDDRIQRESVPRQEDSKSTLKAQLDILQTNLSISESQLANMRAAYSELESTRATLSETYKSTLATIRLQAAEIAAMQDVIAGSKLIGTSATTTHDDHPSKSPSTTVLPSSGVQSPKGSLQNVQDTSYPIPRSESEASPLPHVKVQAKRRRRAPRVALSANEQYSLEAAMNPARLMVPGVREKLTVRGPREVTLWNSKSIPYFVVKEEGSNEAVGACYLPEDDNECTTHLNVVPLRPRIDELAPVFADPKAGTVRKVAISTLTLVPIQGLVGEHGVLVAPKNEQSLGNLVVVISCKDQLAEVRRKGISKPVKELIPISSIVLCAMSPCSRTK